MNNLNKEILLNNLNKYDSTALEMLDQALAFMALMVNKLPVEMRKSMHVYLKSECDELGLDIYNFAKDCNEDFQNHCPCDNCKKG
jgi:hypothetical protein